jgi:hypothetical protein
MSIQLAPGALTGVLWARHPTIQHTGLVLDLGLAEPTASTHRTFTCVCFSPTEDHVFCFGDSAGAVFVVSLLKNKYTLVARVNSPVTDITFTNDKSVIAVASAMAVLLVNVATAKVVGKLRGPHQNRVLRVVSPPLLRGVAVTMSTESIAFWNTVALTCQSTVQGRFVSVAVNNEDLYTLEAGGVVKAWTLGSREVIKTTVLAGHRLRVLAASSAVVIAGTETATVVIFGARHLEPIWVAGIHGDSRSVHVAFCGEGLFSCLQADGLVSFTAIGKRPDAAAAADGTAAAVDAAVTVGQSLEVCLPANHVPITVAGSRAHYAAVVSTTNLQLYHLPTAKIAHDEIVAAQQSNASGRRVVEPFLAIGKRAADAEPAATSRRHSTATEAKHADEAAVAEEADKVPRSVARSVASPPNQDTLQKNWVKVNLLQSAEKPIKDAPPMFASDAVRERYGAVAAARSGTGEAEQQPGGGLGGRAAPAQTPRRSSSAAAGAASSAKRGGQSVQASTISRGSQYDNLSTVSVDSLINVRDLADDRARRVNFDKLRGILMRFGVYPERFRTYIWRFLLEYSDKAATAPYFAVLASRGAHPGVQSLLKPFPLPDSKLHNAFAKSLSCLAHHAPVFAVAHFAPSIVYPFQSVFSSDVQSTVEATLGFCSNWGKEFFTYYPHAPVALMSLITHLLKAEDPELLTHFTDVGLGPEVFVWDVISAVYTEVLTKSEWLQIMDHALTNEPLWLWLFHVRWLCQLKPAFMVVKDSINLASMFRRATPFDLNGTIQQTYRLHGRCPRNELTAPYEKFTAPARGDYPNISEVHESVVTSRLEELEQLQRHEEEVKGLHERTRTIERQLADAAMIEDAFVARQRALVNAKYDGNSAVWTQRVVLEQERNRLRDIEHEARLSAVKAHLAAAERLEHVQADLHMATTAAERTVLDRDQEAMKWRFADRMSNLEVERLEAAARARLNATLRVASVVDAHAAPSTDPIRAMSNAVDLDHSRHLNRSRERESSELPTVRVAGTSAPPRAARQPKVKPHDRSAESIATTSAAPQPEEAAPVPTPRPPTERTPPTAERPVRETHEVPPRAAASTTSSRRGEALLYDPEADENATTAAQQQHDRDVSGRPPTVPATPSTSEKANQSTPRRRSASARTQTTPPAATTESTPSSQAKTTTTNTTSTTGSTDVTYTGDPTTSSGHVTTDCDAGTHFHKLHLEIRQRVEQAQREQQSALAALRSRYARTAFNEVAAARGAGSESTITGPAHTTRPVATLADGTASDVSAETSVTELHVGDDEDYDVNEGSEVTMESTERSSMAEAVMRRQDPRMFQFRRQ